MSANITVIGVALSIGVKKHHHNTSTRFCMDCPCQTTNAKLVSFTPIDGVKRSDITHYSYKGDSKFNRNWFYIDNRRKKATPQYFNWVLPGLSM